MKYSTKITLVFLLPLILFSCEKEISFDNKLIEPKLVINGFIQQDSLIDVTIATSKPIPGIEKDFEWINSATVQLFVDGVEKETLVTYNIVNKDTIYYGNFYPGLTPPSHPTKGYRSTTTKAEAGKTYKLKVTYPGFQTVTCETTIPVPIAIEKIDTLTKTIDNYGYSRTVTEVKLKFKDTPDKKNYYRIGYTFLRGISMIGYYDPKNPNAIDTSQYVYLYTDNKWAYIESNDPIINPEQDANDLLFGGQSNMYNIFNDDFIDGKDYELSFFVDNNNFSEDVNYPDFSKGEFFRLNIELQSITREAYLYMKSVQVSGFSDGFLTEPVQVFSNIENGIGIFAGFSSNQKLISKGEYPIDGINYKEPGNGGYNGY